MQKPSKAATWLLVFLLGSVGLDAGEGYLRSVGPMALRWQSAIPGNPELLRALPPLLMEDKPATGPETNSSSQPKPPPSSAAIPSSTNTADLFEEFPNLDEPVPVVEGPAPALPPELLPTLFYSPGGTNHGSTLALPLNFVPPTASGPRSSTATFSNENP